MSKYVVELKSLNKTYIVKENNNDTIKEMLLNIFKSNGKRKIKALKNINISIKKGEFVGVIGHNGSGKSTLLNVIIGSVPPDKKSTVNVNGKLLRLTLGMGFDKNLTARENIYINGAMLGLSFKQIGESFSEIIEFAELEEFVETKIKFYSKGMRSRLAFAIAIKSNAEILLLDEFFGGVGDVNFRKKSDAVFKSEFIKSKTILLVSHSAPLIAKHCKRTILLDKGELKFDGDTKEALKLYNKIMDNKMNKAPAK